MKLFFVLFLIVCPFTFYAQKGNVEIIKDKRIDELVKEQGEIIPPATVPQISGYRIQLFFDTDKKLVDDARSQFVAQFPNVDTYVTFKAPNYFLKVGNFRTRLEAEKVKATVDRDFPTNFIVNELIFLPRID